LLLAFGVALAGCTTGPGYQSQAYSGSSYGYYGAPTGNQYSTCGAVGTCGASGVPALTPEDEHAD
jgi:hypothetical protein